MRGVNKPLTPPETNSTIVCRIERCFLLLSESNVYMLPPDIPDIDCHSPGLLQPGRNCWRIEHAHRFSMLVDADIYFRTLRTAFLQAKHSIFILSWDIDSRTRLVPEGANDGYPEILGDFLHTLVASKPSLHVYVLNWDFAMLYALEREWLPIYKLGWRTHRRLAFQMDGTHPIGASHHQKIVVVDDALAFVGGLDLTRCRWDTPAHAAYSPYRRDVDGKSYAPFHDVQAMVDGEVAQALGELVRSRWHGATGKWPVRHEQPPGVSWIAEIAPDVTDVEVAIVRTEPSFGGKPGIYEVRQLHLDAIASARHSLFFENQYFTSDLICQALSSRLAEFDGPEIVMLSPQTQSGWLEQSTMGVLRARVHGRLRKADCHGRYQLFYPSLPELKTGCLNVHSKVFSVDEDVFSVGSANLSNRSMAFDTECNLVLEARGSDAEITRIRQAIARLRNRLLAEHLGTSPDTVTEQMHAQGSLLGAIQKLQKPMERSLIVLEPLSKPELDALIPDQAAFDPERPINPEELIAQFVPKDARKPVPRRLVGLSMLAVALALLAVAWRWTPLGEWVNLASLVALARDLEALPFTPVAVLAGYVAAGLLVVPVTLLIAVTGFVFGPIVGTCYAIAGTLVSAIVTYGAGQWLGRETVRQMLGPRLNRLSRHLAKRGILAMMIIRLLPIAPFTIVNIMAGASHIRFYDYLIGTLLGMMPGIVMTVIFMHHLAETVRSPSMGTLVILAVVALLLFGSAIGLQKLFDKRDAETS